MISSFPFWWKDSIDYVSLSRSPNLVSINWVWFFSHLVSLVHKFISSHSIIMIIQCPERSKLEWTTRNWPCWRWNESLMTKKEDFSNHERRYDDLKSVITSISSKMCRWNIGLVLLLLCYFCMIPSVWRVAILFEKNEVNSGRVAMILTSNCSENSKEAESLSVQSVFTSKLFGESPPLTTSSTTL